MRFRRKRKRRTWWTGNAVSFALTNQAADFTFISTMVRSDEIREIAPHGATLLRIVLDYWPEQQGPTTGGDWNIDPVDLFILAQTVAQDDAGVSMFVQGTNVLKPFVQPDLAGPDLGASRSYVWTKRMYGNNRTAETNIVQVNQFAWGQGVYNNWSPMMGGYPWLDLRVKRRLEVGEDLVFGQHYPNGISSSITIFDKLNYRVLLAG